MDLGKLAWSRERRPCVSPSIWLLITVRLIRRILSRQLGASDLEIDCLDCDLLYNLNISMEFDVVDGNITAASVGVIVEEFEQTAVVQISLNETLDIDQSINLIQVPLTPSSVRNDSPRPRNLLVADIYSCTCHRFHPSSL